MSTTSQFYMARAEENQLAADREPLGNVRERFERSAIAWRAMADRLIRMETMRTEQADAKALAGELLNDSELLSSDAA